jgi:TonB family protein
VEVNSPKGGLARGEYSATIVSPSRWREQIDFGNYQRVRVGDSQGYWQTTTVNFQPKFIFQLEEMLHPENLLRLNANQTLSKISNRKKGNAKLKCTTVMQDRRANWTICFDESNGALVSIEYPIPENGNPPEVSRIEYADFKIQGESLIPFQVRAHVRDQEQITVTVEQANSPNDVSSVLFSVPNGAELWHRCDGVEEPELLNRTTPIYPEEAQARRESGRIIFYAVVEADGSPSHMGIIKCGPRSLEDAAAQAVAHWHYKPAMCGGIAIRSEIMIEVDFFIRQ